MAEAARFTRIIRIPAAQITGAVITNQFYIGGNGLVNGGAVDQRFVLANAGGLVLPPPDAIWDLSQFVWVRAALQSGGVTTTGTCLFNCWSLVDPNLGQPGYTPDTKRLMYGNAATANVINGALSVDGLFDIGVGATAAEGIGAKTAVPARLGRVVFSVQFGTAVPTVSGDWFLTIDARYA